MLISSVITNTTKTNLHTNNNDNNVDLKNNWIVSNDRMSYGNTREKRWLSNSRYSLNHSLNHNQYNAANDTVDDMLPLNH